MVIAAASMRTWMRRVNATSFQPIQVENKHVCCTSGQDVRLSVGVKPLCKRLVCYEAVQNALLRYVGNVLLHHQRQVLDLGIQVP